eukprot:2972065-Pyramimonas_sp.AAC.1
MADGVGGSHRIAHTSAMHRRRRRDANRAPYRAASAIHRRCGAILRPCLSTPTHPNIWLKRGPRRPGPP